MSCRRYYNGYMCNCRKQYGVGRLLFDFALTMITGGLWFIWILIKFLRTNSR